MDTFHQIESGDRTGADTRDTVQISVCGTCIDCSNSGEVGIGAGQALFDMLAEILAAHPAWEGIELSKIRCLMACTEGCVLSVASRGKMKYLLGRLSPDPDLAEQILDFAAMYARSPSGVTPNHEWPPLLAPHFIGRIPPATPNDPSWDDDGADL